MSTRVVRALCTLAVMGPAEQLFAQEPGRVKVRSAVAADAVPHSVAGAESFLRDLGAERTSCVEVGNREKVEIGDFEAAPFATYRDFWRQGGSKLWWIFDSVDVAAVPELTLRARLLEADSTAVIFSTTTAASARPSGIGSVMYPGGFRLPAPGRWLLVATAGQAAGCAVYDL